MFSGCLPFYNIRITERHAGFLTAESPALEQGLMPQKVLSEGLLPALLVLTKHPTTAGGYEQPSSLSYSLLWVMTASTQGWLHWLCSTQTEP